MFTEKIMSSKWITKSCLCAETQLTSNKYCVFYASVYSVVQLRGTSNLVQCISSSL